MVLLNASYPNICSSVANIWLDKRRKLNVPTQRGALRRASELLLDWLPKSHGNKNQGEPLGTQKKAGDEGAFSKKILETYTLTRLLTRPGPTFFSMPSCAVVGPRRGLVGASPKTSVIGDERLGLRMRFTHVN